MESLDKALLEIRVLNAYDVKDQLKDLNYRWNSAKKYWHTVVLKEGFSLDALLGQPWARNGVRFEIYSEKGELLHRKITGYS